jgi:caspase domain-containing protein
MAQANFNVRGWQGRWRHTAPTALFFLPSTVTHRTAIAVSLGSIPRQGLRDAPAKVGRAERNKPGRVHCQIPTSSVRQARPRMALAIGNRAYSNVTALPNPSNAARDIAGALRDLGFKVIESYNLGSTAMRGKIEEWRGAAGRRREFALSRGSRCRWPARIISSFISSPAPDRHGPTAGSRRLVICLRPGLFAQCAHQQTGGTPI